VGWTNKIQNNSIQLIENECLIKKITYNYLAPLKVYAETVARKKIPFAATFSKVKLPPK
jgi:hypothetical protein